MATRQTENAVSNQTDERQAVKRRGLIAGAAALAAGLLAKQVSEPVRAATSPLEIPTSSGSGQAVNVVVDQTNINGTLPNGTAMINANANINTNNVIGLLGQGGGPGGPGVMGLMKGVTFPGASFGAAIFGQGLDTAIGVFGVGNVGVHGTSTTSSGYGVIGEGDTGVHGESQGSTNGSGVEGLYFGSGTNGIGVKGSVTGGAAGTTAVYGNNQSTGTGGIGVYGYSPRGNGVYGLTEAAGQAGVFGQTGTPGAVGFTGYSTNPGAFAGYFNGKVFASHTPSNSGDHTVVALADSGFAGVFGQALVGIRGAGILGSTFDPATGTNNTANYAGFFNGNLTVVNGNKNVAVPFPDGSHRLLYCVEAPEAWFEDFGTGTL
ncbi:MAG: hypothetical protein M3Y58_04500, partial [Chloroflexota bacterium]|nr:hypothetical protein [Chloroflexota bacterium]